MNASFRMPQRQRGASLAVVLILLLLMAMLCASSLRGTAASERMAAASYDRELAFQAAETALREAEELLRSHPSFPAAGCAGGLCALKEDVSSGDLPRWRDPSISWRPMSSALEVSNASTGPSIAIQAEYLIELLPEAPNWPGCDRVVPQHPKCMSARFRVTARSEQPDRARVVLQTNVSYRR
jgi:type IV pilus assembly protein PilX